MEDMFLWVAITLVGLLLVGIFCIIVINSCKRIKSAAAAGNEGGSKDIEMRKNKNREADLM